MSLGAHQAGAYPGFRSMKRLGVLLLPPGWDASPSQGYPSSKFAGTHLYTWVERGSMRVKYFAQEHNAVPRPGLELGPPDPASSALTIRPPRLPQKFPLTDTLKRGNVKDKNGIKRNKHIVLFHHHAIGLMKIHVIYLKEMLALAVSPLCQLPCLTFCR